MKSMVQKVIEDENYIYSAEFALRMANFGQRSIKDNGDGTITFTRPCPFSRTENRESVPNE